MELITLNPHGYCSGVAKAISLIEKVKLEHPNKDIYLLGLPLHNEEVVASLSSTNCFLIDEKKIDLKEAISKIPERSILIFSAHGHPAIYEEIAKQRKLKTVDCTCEFVEENLKYAKSIKGDVIYIGKGNHIEATSFLANFNCPFFDVNSFSFKEEVNLTSPTLIYQTTLTLNEVYKSFELIKQKYPDAKIGQERCLATKMRQQSILNLDSSIDIVLILGSTLSSNSKALLDLAKSKGFESYLCLNLEEVKKLNLEGNKKIALTSGASTSKKTFDEVKEYLLSK